MSVKFYLLLMVVLSAFVFSACSGGSSSGGDKDKINDLTSGGKDKDGKTTTTSTSGENFGGSSTTLDKEDKDKTDGGNETTLPDGGDGTGEGVDGTDGGGVTTPDQSLIIDPPTDPDLTLVVDPPPTNTRKTIGGSLEGIDGNVTITLNGIEQIIDATNPNFTFNVDEDAEVTIDVKSNDNTKACFLAVPYKYGDPSSLNIRCVKRYKLGDWHAEFNNGLTSCVLDGHTGLNAANFTDEVEWFHCNEEIDSVNGLEYLINLNQLSIGGSTITSVDTTNLTNLTMVYLSGNLKLMSVDFTYNRKITSLNIGHNNMTSLDLSHLTELTDFEIENTKIAKVDLSNNPSVLNLTLNLLPMAGYSTINTSDVLKLATPGNIRRLEIHGSNLSTFDFGSFPRLQEILITSNPLSSADLSANTALERINLSDNWDLSKVTFPTTMSTHTVNLSKCKLTSLDVSGMARLGTLKVDENQLTNLDVSNNTSIGFLYAQKNSLTTMDVSALTALGTLELWMNDLTEVTFAPAHIFTRLDLSHNQLTSLTLPSAPDLVDFNLSFNDLQGAVDLSGVQGLVQLGIMKNPDLTALTLYKKPQLLHVDSGVTVTETNP